MAGIFKRTGPRRGILQFPSRLGQRLRGVVHSRWFLQTLRWSLVAGMGFVLPAAAMGPRPLPVVYGYLLSLAGDGQALVAGATGCLGTWIFWQGTEQTELLTGIFLSLLAAGIFSGSSFRRRQWFFPLVSGLIALGLGLAFLLGQREVQTLELGILALRAALAALAQWIFRQVPERSGFLAGAVGLGQLGLSQILVGPWLNLGFLVAGILAGGGLGLPVALGAGLAVDLTRNAGTVSVGAICCLSCLLTRLLGRRAGMILPGALALAWSLANGSGDGVLLVSLALGGLVSGLVPGSKGEEKAATDHRRDRLLLGASTLEYLGKALARRSETPVDGAQLFDGAAAQVCQGCSRWKKCWQEEADQTYRLLAACVPDLLNTGKLPQAFLDRCRRPEPFALAVGQGVVGLRLRRQHQKQVAESRQALAQQYGFLSRFLRQLSEPVPEAGKARFRPQMAARQKGAGGRKETGDQVRWFSGPDHKFYILLCDGMGTGSGAAREARATGELLANLLKAGVQPEEALLTLNQLYVLEGCGGFSTADVLELNLDTARATLFKWGAAPSFIKRRNLVKQLGTAGPPPGVGIGEEYRPEVIRLSMERGQMVVLVSDGLPGAQVVQCLMTCPDSDPQATVRALTAPAVLPDQDDCTAVAVILTGDRG